MNFSLGYNFGGNAKYYCREGHFLELVSGRNATCDVCRRFQLKRAYTCYPCNFDMCEECSMNKNFQKKQDYYTNSSYTTHQQVPAAQIIKLFDRNHQTHLFVGNGVQDNDHTVFACKKSGFNPQNFDPRTGFVIIPTNDGYFQIMDIDHQAFLFVGNEIVNGEDHTVYACPQKDWKDYNDFMKRTSWSFIEAENRGWRLVDKNHNAYLFIGNKNDGGDHTVYACPTKKFNLNQVEYMKRTILDVEGAKQLVPSNRVIKAPDINHNTFMFVGNGVKDNDHTVYACKQTGFKSENFHPRTNLVVIPTGDGFYQIMDTDHQAFFFVGNGVDHGGDHTVYASPRKFWKDYNDFMARTSFSILPVENSICWRIVDKKHNSLLFIGNNDDCGEHTVYSVPMQKFNGSQEFEKRTQFYLS
jgi:ribosomal protein L27